MTRRDVYARERAYCLTADLISGPLFLTDLTPTLHTAGRVHVHTLATHSRDRGARGSRSLRPTTSIAAAPWWSCMLRFVAAHIDLVIIPSN